jgi:hypothetical protein
MEILLELKGAGNGIVKQENNRVGGHNYHGIEKMDS